MNDLPGVEVVGVAPDFSDWYVCLYVALANEAEIIATLRDAIESSGGDPRHCQVLRKAPEFGRRSGYRRVVVRTQPLHAIPMACVLNSHGRSVATAIPSPLAKSFQQG